MEKEERIYPRWALCKDHFQVEIRPLQVEDIDAQITMLNSLDEKELAKLPCDVFDPSYKETIRKQIEDKSVYRLIALHGMDGIVAGLALYRSTSKWYEHTGKVVQVTKPEFRRYGIATVLLDELIPLAESLGIQKLYTELTDIHKEGVRMVKALGMKREGVLHNHMKDSENGLHKLYIYSFEIQQAREVMEERMTQFIRLEHRI